MINLRPLSDLKVIIFSFLDCSKALCFFLKDDKGRIKLLNQNKLANNQSKLYDRYDNQDDYSAQLNHYSSINNNYHMNQNNDENYDDFVTTVRKPNIVIATDDDADVRAPSIKSQASNTNYQQQPQQLNTGGTSLMDKKKQKWLEDKALQEQLLKQEMDHKQKIFNINNGRETFII
jgi:hypothetical protein